MAFNAPVFTKNKTVKALVKETKEEFFKLVV